MRDEKGRGLKKKYVALTYDGEYYYRGIELRKRNYCEFAKDVLRQVLDKVFKEGWTKSQIEKWLREVKRDLYRGKYDEKLIIAMAVNKDIEEYKSIPPHIRAYQIAREMGFEFTDYRVKYVFVKNHVFKGRKTDVMPILNVSDVKKYRIDYERYWNTQVIKPVKRILDSIDDVGGKLDRWFG
jgi:DNA polymerase elongation subunit (family B)